MRRFSLKSQVVAIAFLAMILALVVQGWRSRVEEARLHARLRASEMRYEEYRARVDAFLSDASIRVDSSKAAPSESSRTEGVKRGPKP